MGKSQHNQGGGVNYLCMPKEPEFSDSPLSGSGSGAFILGVEYEGTHATSPFTHLSNDDAPCAVCEVQGRALVLMIPAKRTCPSGWTLEYDGWLASQHSSSRGSDFVCISSGMEAADGGSANQNAGQLWVVKAKSGALPSPPYINNYLINCIVCTK